MMSGSAGAVVIALVAALVAVPGCGDDEEESAADTEAAPSQHEPTGPALPTVGASPWRPCDEGSRPDYFVPGGAPAVVFGCARLTVSGRTVEFSANHERTGGGKYRKYNLCLNPAYPGRGDSSYIPATCIAEPVPKRPDVLDASPAVQEGPIRRYGLVIWGTTGIGTRKVTAHSGDEQAEAVVLPVEQRPVLDAAKAEGAFSVFIVELPMAASCEQVTVRGSGVFGEATALVEPRLNLCERIE